MKQMIEDSLCSHSISLGNLTGLEFKSGPMEVTERSGWGSSVASYIGGHYKEFALGINYQCNC